jgi:hypothetical protein
VSTGEQPERAHQIARARRDHAHRAYACVRKLLQHAEHLGLSYEVFESLYKLEDLIREKVRATEGRQA